MGSAGKVPGAPLLILKWTYGHVQAYEQFPDTFLETGDLIMIPLALSSSQLRLKRVCVRVSALVGQTRRRGAPPEQFLEPRLTQCCRK